MSFNFPPKGWALANGQLLPINQNQAIFALLGTTYGGNGQTNFALPNFRGRTPIHMGNGHTLGEMGGKAIHTLSVSEMPAHTHPLKAVDTGTRVTSPVNNSFANSKPANQYSNQQGSLVNLAPSAVSITGESQAHLNMQPYLTVTFCIALQGTFPSQN